jgi:hypothetical protein
VKLRFIIQDTYEGKIDNPLSLNLYTYVWNNPLSYNDPSGNWPKWVGSAWNGIKSGTVSTVKWASKSKAEQNQDIADAGLASYQFMAGNDIDTAFDPNSTDFERKQAFDNLAMLAIPIEGELAGVASKLGAKALTKAEANLLTTRLLKEATQVADHHIMPKFRGNTKYSSYFSDRGINVDDFTVTLLHGKASHHLKFIHGQGKWNDTFY